MIIIYSIITKIYDCDHSEIIVKKNHIDDRFDKSNLNIIQQQEEKKKGSDFASE